MSSPTAARGVFTAAPSYVAAVAGLPVSAELTDSIRGAVVVVPGSGNWWQALLEARQAGAAAVVVADPGVLPREALEPGEWPGGMPVIIERPRLRPDVVADAVQTRDGSPAAIITVECAAPAPLLGAVVCDGLGWARSLAQGPLTLRAGTASAEGRMGLLDAAGPGGALSVSLLATADGGAHSGGLLQILALGEVRSEVTVDQPAVLARVETSRGEGTLRAPERYESSARLALRRAFRACSSGDPVTDLDDMLEDLVLTAQLTST
jgi:hypothetical protein